METVDSFHPAWRYAVAAMLAWLAFAGVWLGHEMYEQHCITRDVETVQAAEGRELERAQERLAAGGEEAAMYLLQELQQSETREKAIRPIVALEKVIRGHAWMVGIFQVWSLEALLEELRAGQPDGDAKLIAAVVERALEAVATAERQKDAPFEISREEYIAVRSLGEKRRLALWARRKRLAEALALTMEHIVGEERTPHRLVLHGISDLFGDESPAVRRYISRANAAVGEPIIPWLIKVVEKERVKALMVVATTDYTKQENEDRLQAKNDRARLEAAKLLGGFDSPKAKKVLARYAKDPVIGTEARRALSESLGKEG